MRRHGFTRIAVACPTVHLANPHANATETCKLLSQAALAQVSVVVFPELGLTGYTCGDLFQHKTLLDAAESALKQVIEHTRTDFPGIALVGLPFAIHGKLYNVAAAVAGGQLLGLVPKIHLPTYMEFYEGRHFTSGRLDAPINVHIAGQCTKLSPRLLFPATTTPNLVIGIEICEDLWVPEPPSGGLALAGATVLVNLSASNEVLGKAAYRRSLVTQQSARCIAAYAYASSGWGESTADLVYGGHGIIAENGSILAESDRFLRGNSLTITEIDLQNLDHERRQQGTFGSTWPVKENYIACPWSEGNALHAPGQNLSYRTIEAHPFVPKNEQILRERCGEIFSIQTSALARRLESAKPGALTLGVSGGLDSTLALLVACKTFDTLNIPRSRLLGLTMPGFGTTGRTLNNALTLMQHLGITSRTVDIRSMALAEWRALGHSPLGIDIAGLDLPGFQARLDTLAGERKSDLIFENVQARLRTSLLMNSGFVLGTGDLSESALGWCTYNGDHMSMYNVNAGVPKTLVRFLVAWAAQNEFEGESRRCLLDIVATPISPELLPPRADGTISQTTEESVGPYELHDFFLFHLLRHGADPAKIMLLARHAHFDNHWSVEDIRKWLKIFLTRFFAQQYKRDCVPNGPKIGSVSLSPRGDWRMPSDAIAKAWLDRLDC